MKALVSYQPQDADFSSQFLCMLEREGHPHLHTNGRLPNGVLCSLYALALCCAIVSKFSCRTNAAMSCIVGRR